jgi:adenosylhomocysteine nucleosidase
MRIAVIISADAEWKAVLSILKPSKIIRTKLGETFEQHKVHFIHGGWGKIAAAASTQFVIGKFHPDLLINLGTCGGIDRRSQLEEIVLVTKTVVYDIVEQMEDPVEAIKSYSCDLDYSWYPGDIHSIGMEESIPINPKVMLSADRDICIEDIPLLVKKYNASVCDWESGAIAWVAKKNRIHCLILRGVTDLVSASGGEAYDNPQLFYKRTNAVMEKLLILLRIIVGELNHHAG